MGPVRHQVAQVYNEAIRYGWGVDPLGRWQLHFQSADIRVRL